MIDQIEDRNLASLERLVAPGAVKARLPLAGRAEGVVRDTRAAVRDILAGRDRRRMLAVVGPCSIHDPVAAIDYASRLAVLARELDEALVIVMRTYFEKPRTTVGWKGLINDPCLDGSCDIEAGLALARSILVDINALGLACGGELLDPISPQYVADLLSWAAIGARTAESQTHREMASGVSMPVGFKNGTDGAMQVAVNAIVSARQPHSFVGVSADGSSAVVKTRGNPDSHLVLRGGGGRPNYAAEDLDRAEALLGRRSPSRAILVDCSHDNSNKQHQRQAEACRSVVEQFGAGRASLAGFMLESNIEAGNQAWARDRELDYGVSITDACIGWEETERLLRCAAEALASAYPALRAAAG